MAESGPYTVLDIPRVTVPEKGSEEPELTASGEARMSIPVEIPDNEYEGTYVTEGEEKPLEPEKTESGARKSIPIELVPDKPPSEGENPTEPQDPEPTESGEANMPVPVDVHHAGSWDPAEPFEAQESAPAEKSSTSKAVSEDPWNSMSTHAALDGYLIDNQISTPEGWATMTMAEKKTWLSDNA